MHSATHRPTERIRSQTEEQLLERRRKNAERQKQARPKQKELSRDLGTQCREIHFIGRHNLETFDESSVKYHEIGPMKYICCDCGALLFKGENHTGRLSSSATFGLCCSKGAIKLPPIKDPPQKLKNLFTGNSQKYRNFRQNIRAYNSSLAFASMCFTGHEYTFKSRGPYCFKINGQVYHRISQLQPEVGITPGFSQIHIYDQQNELDYHS